MPLVALKLILPNSASGISLDAILARPQNYQMQKTAEITAAAISQGNIVQFAMDIALRRWMRRNS